MADNLATVAVRHQVYLERLKSGESEKFTAFLRRIDRSLRQKLSGDNLTEFGRTRIERALSGVDQLLKGEFDDYRQEISRDLVDIARYEAEFEATSLENAAKSSAFESVLPSETQIRAAIFSRPLSVRGADGGKLLDDFVKDWTTAERRRVVGTIRQGVFEGRTNAQIIRTLRGTKGNGYRDGVLAISRRNADAIVRTSVQHVSSVARAETWSANADIVTGYRIVATLDSRTSTICRSLDGEVFKLGKGPKPPLHIRCRSTTVAELADDFSDLSEGRTRASKDGPVPAGTSYYDWLKDQPAEFQDDVLGPVRGQLFRDGGLTAEQFAKLNLGKNFQPLSLADMRKKEPQAFAKAFGGKRIRLTKKAEAALVMESQQQKVVTDWIGSRNYQKRLGEIDNPRIKKTAEQYGLSQAEQVAIREYTDVGYSELNDVLRGQRTGNSAIIEQAADVLRSALGKLPNHVGQVVRRDALPAEILADHMVGNIVDYKAFTSATFGKEDVFLNRPHRLVMSSRTGKKIDWISKYGRKENEVLFNSPTRFLVVDRTDHGNGEIEIELTEIDDD